MSTPLLEIWLEEAPPSDNKIYWTGPHARGKKILTKEGRAFKNGLREIVSNAWKEAGMPVIARDMMLELDVWIRLDHVFTRTEEAQFKFVRVDVQNRGKLLCDMIAESLGFDDSQIFRIRFHKCEGPPGTVVKIYRNEETPAWPTREQTTPS